MEKKYLCIDIYLIVIICFLSFGKTIAQVNIKKEVEVVQPYQPVILDASKINILPVINDSTTVKPSFQYNVIPSMINTEYQVSQINAAKMLNVPISKLYNGYLVLGIGNYSTPLAELYVNTLRSKSYSAGAKLDYQSSSGNVTLDNDQSVFAGYSNASAQIFGKKFYKDGYIFAEAGLHGNTVYDYGYNTEKDTFLLLNKNNIKQSYFGAGLRAGIQSFHTDSARLSYQGDINYNYFQDRFQHDENNFEFNGRFSEKYEYYLVGIDVGYDQLKRSKSLDSTGFINSLFVLNPSICFTTGEYRLKLGVNATVEDQMNTVTPRLYPMADFQFAVVKDVLVPFIGIYGKVSNHSYQDIATENPYILPDLLVQNTNNKLAFYGGIRGSLGLKASYIIKLDYSQLINQYFYVNDTINKLQNHLLQNQFSVVYDNVNLYTTSLDVNYDYSSEWSFSTKIHYYQYNLTFQPYAWQKPNYDGMFTVKYNLGNKILLNFDVLGVGKRYAKLYHSAETSKEMPGVLDFNLSAEYRYTKILSFWIHLNNFTASKYYIWNQYPSQQFNFMVGMSYSL